MSSESVAGSSKPSTYYVCSKKPPEEAALFGLRGSDLSDIWPHTEEISPVSPEEWGFTGPNEDGICQYCQLMLHPDAPEVIVHQPNLDTLIASKCVICDWVEVSIVQGSPQLVRWYQQGHAELCGAKSTMGVTVALSRESKYTRAVASVGPRGRFAEKGVPLNLTTSTRLGGLISRVFWQPYDTRGDHHSGARLEILQNWLGDCLENHGECASVLSGKGNARLPTRVLDLTGSQDRPSAPGDLKIRLRETQEGEVGDYVALSYCWGPDPEHHFKTSQSNIEKLKNGIQFQDVPLTQREAILAALRLGIRYVWIDALCIIQDSPEDWQREAATMSTVYSNAIVTFAAASAENPAVGLLNPFQAARCVNIHGDLAIVRMETHTSIDKSSEPLNTRAWVLQESVLSPRIVSFGREQWLWKCPSRYTTEDGLVDASRVEGDSLNYWYTIMQREASSDAADYLKHWYRLVGDYSRRRLTFRDDKLKAIAGMANVFAQKIGFQLIAGLWLEDIAKGLLWQATSRGVKRVQGTIPSWSWASVDGQILVQDFADSLPVLGDITRIEQEWQGEPMTSPLVVARLHLQGKVLRARIGKQSTSQRLRYHLVRGPESEEILGEAFLDEMNPIKEEFTSVYCLYTYFVPAASGELESFMLLLVPDPEDGHSGGVTVFRRIGIAIVWEQTKFPDGKRGMTTQDEAEEMDMILA